MIIKGSQRGGAKQLSAHLLNMIDNDHVELHELRGFVADTLEEALLESYAISRGTNAQQHMFSVSFSPPPGKDVSITAFEDAFARVEAKYGLDQNSRAIVFHEKNGRRHAHVVWSRINHETMTAVNLPFFKRELREISRCLFIEHKWKMPQGLMNSEARISNEFTLAEFHQTKRAKLDPNDIKAMFVECWAASDSKQGFEAALHERGYFLAQGDKRCFVAVDLTGKVYSLSRFTGIKKPELEDRLGDSSAFPTVEEKRAEIVQRYRKLVQDNIQTTKTHHKALQKELDEKLVAMREKHRHERALLDQSHAARLLQERRERQRKLSKGLRGLWETLSGRRTKIIEEHRLEDEKSIRRDLKERQVLIFRQLEERSRLQVFIQKQLEQLSEDIEASLALSAKEQKHDGEIVHKVRENPEMLLSMLTEKHSTFTRSAIQRELKAYIPDRNENRLALSRIMSSPELVELHATENGKNKQPHYSTREMIDLEKTLLQSGINMHRQKEFHVSSSTIKEAIRQESLALGKQAGVTLSNEQIAAIRHITEPDNISCVIGVAGAGKSTMLAAARHAWEKAGYRVLGAALAGKAVKGLEQSSGIQSRTLASYELSWKHDRHSLQKGDILVIDEAGMIGSRQLAKFIQEAEDKGAKLVLIGDDEQLQPINAGAPFRVLTEKLGSSVLCTVHRQREDWQKEASSALARGETAHALEAYQKQGNLEFCSKEDDVIMKLANDYMQDFIKHGDKGSRLALAHRRADVKHINDCIREMRKHHGELENAHTYKTSHGKREFAVGDRLLFTKNDRPLGLKNGMLGDVIETNQNRLKIRLDDREPTGGEKIVTIDCRDYDSFNHGYATTTINRKEQLLIEALFWPPKR